MRSELDLRQAQLRELWASATSLCSMCLVHRRTVAQSRRAVLPLYVQRVRRVRSARKPAPPRRVARAACGARHCVRVDARVVVASRR